MTSIRIAINGIEVAVSEDNFYNLIRQLEDKKGIQVDDLQGWKTNVRIFIQFLSQFPILDPSRALRLWKVYRESQRVFRQEPAGCGPVQGESLGSRRTLR